MERTQVFKLIYAGIAIFGTYLGASRLWAGDWGQALLPLLIVTFCVYRLFTMDE